ncbi:PcfK-like family protein [Dysgonomonas macrotermitis]|uniref:PcfK-like protein n=1 Tax=Dysgonomonas macrotermitis TaxID=1346286 RepID=A0A1M5J6C4_9BACT|nr:PcfK-like family protein [Dysgonomonas macrotermitis]SHG36176.1 PcfK-like protein [Dysgonomonas macrotermitis]
MKSTAYFTRTILTYLEQRAETDPLFAKSFAKTDKNIDDCITYILNTVQKSGCNGFTDIEVYSMAVHYYDEDIIEVGNSMNGCHIAVNHVVELTEEEKAEARQEAIKKLQNEAYTKMKQPVKKAKRVELNPQPTLFDF